MKILNLKIKDPLDNIIRDIDFNENGISFIYGDVQEPENKKGTLNSLGKTLLLKFIDYIYGAKEDNQIVKDDLNGYILEAVIKKDNQKHLIRRILGNSTEISIDSKIRNLSSYKEFLGIKRNLISKQIIINKKASIISFNTNPGQEDNVNFINLLNLNGIVENIKQIYSSQDNIKKYKSNKQDLISIYGELDGKKIDEEIYFVDKEVNRLTEEIDEISEKVKNIEISDIQTNIIEEYSQKSGELKKIKISIERLKLEKNRLEEFISNSNKVDITSEHIIAIYNKAKLEVPQLIKRKIEEVENFHKTVYEERKLFLGNKKKEIEIEIKKNQESILKLTNEVDELGKIISLNQVYQESIAVYQNFNSKLQDIKFKEGQLSQIKDIDNKILKEDTKLTVNFENANEKMEGYLQEINKYRDFIYKIIKSMYDDEVNSYFNIKIRKKHLTRRPIEIEINLKGDTGEGVGEVKKNIIDYLIFKYNVSVEFLIQDSSCYNGIDPRQVSGMLENLDKTALSIDKQAIISINSYQLGDNLQFIENIKNKSSLILSEKDKLLKFDF